MTGGAEIDDSSGPSGPRESGTKERLIAAAGPIFARAGFEAATVREICEAASANVAAIHYHFGDKWGLYVAAIEEAHRALSEAVPFPQWPAEMSAERKLSIFIRSMVRRMMDVHDIGWPGELLTREILSPSAACQPLIESNFRPHFRGLLAIVQELVGRPIAVEDLERHAFSVIAQCFHHRMANAFIKRVSSLPHERHDDLEALIEHVSRFSIAAIRGWEATDSPTSHLDSTGTEETPPPLRFDPGKSWIGGGIPRPWPSRSESSAGRPTNDSVPLIEPDTRP